MNISKCMFFAAVAAAAIFFTACSPSYNSIKRMQKMEEGVGNPTTKEELEEAIKKYEQRAMDLAMTDAQIGVWYKILGTRYIDEQEYGKALEAFRTALLYYPDIDSYGGRESLQLKIQDIRRLD